jgi:hypothetical protein
MSTVLHIGGYKTGSTSIQLWLRDHADLLAAHGARFPHGWLRRDNHLELALILMDQHRLSPARTRGDEWRDPQWCELVEAQVRADLALWSDVTTVLSAEDTSLLRSHDELVALRELVGDAHIVVYLRDRQTFLAAWEDTLVHKLDLPTSRDPYAYNCVLPESALLDYGGQLDAWQSHFSQVTVLNYDRIAARDGSVIPSFARLLSIEDPGETSAYWLNGRGGTYDHREPGLRWTHGLPFGGEPLAAVDQL